MEKVHATFPSRTRRGAKSADRQLGGAPIKMTTILRIGEADAASGKVTFIRDSQLDPEAMRGFALAMVQKLGLAADAPLSANVAEMIKTMKLSIEGRTEMDVKAGMTRSLREVSTITLSAMGQTLVKKEVKTITVTAAP